MEYAFQKIDKNMKFFSVYIFMERLEDDFWEDDRYTEKEEVHLCSLDTFSPMTACPPSASPQANAGRAQARLAGRAGIALSFIEKKKACGSFFFDLVGNFWIDREKNERILKDVKRIEGSGILIKN
jgi:hypothetical protein